ncbi:hypothetical protein MMC07_002079 [Pseudocyphellaria aurata]|nr:hypothetical protein [Pseudocyphellaria aurata]
MARAVEYVAVNDGVKDSRSQRTRHPVAIQIRQLIITTFISKTTVDKRKEETPRRIEETFSLSSDGMMMEERAELASTGSQGRSFDRQPPRYAGDAGTWLLDRNSLAESQRRTSKCPSTKTTKASQRAATAADDMYKQPVNNYSAESNATGDTAP